VHFLGSSYLKSIPGCYMGKLENGLCLYYVPIAFAKHFKWIKNAKFEKIVF
jgi:hypothetical protein